MSLLRPVAVAALLVVALPATAAAAEPDEVAAVVAEQGVYVEPGSSATVAEISDLVSALRNAGERASIVVLAEEPPGGAVTFADAVADALVEDELLLVIAPESYGFGGTPTVFTEAELDVALDSVSGGESDAELAGVVVASLVGEDGLPDGPEATAAPEAPGSEEPGAGVGWLPIALVVGLLLLGFLWWRSRRGGGGPAVDPRLLEAKTAVQRQLDDVANDIIDLEDEVRTADVPAATEAYAAAGETYNEVSDLYPAASAPESLLDLANRLDEAIWQLDSVEAIIDGREPPPRPRPQALPAPPPTPGPTDADEAPGLPPRPDYGEGAPAQVPPRPEYERRDSRRSSYGGGSLLEILIGVGGMVMAGNRAPGRSGRGGLGDLFGGGPSPPAPQYPRIDLQSPKASRPRPQGGGGRVRTGRRRRT